MKGNHKDVSSGDCPECKKEGCLEYGMREFDGGSVFYPFVCSKCKAEGKEWYVLKYDGMTVYKKGKRLKERLEERGL